MSRIGIVVAAVVAAAVAGGGIFLWQAGRAKDRAVEPVVFAAPDLFPPDTVMFASIHDTEADWKDLEALRAKFEPTATWSLIAGDRGPGSGPLGALKKAWDEMGADVEARLGRRPDAAEFFRVFGGDLALGLSPLPKGAGLGGLLVTRLPDEAELARLKELMGKNQTLRQRQAPPAHGYPVWYEELEAGRTLHYGVGGGHLFLSDDQGLLDAAMTSLSVLAAAGPDTPRPPSLAADPEFKAGVPGPWEEVRVAMFLRKGASIGSKVEQMAPDAKGSGDQVDSILARTFSAAPGKETMAFSASGPSGSRAWSASWGDFSLLGRAWEQRLPADLCMAWIPRPVAAGVREKAFGADYEALRSKRLWKAIDELSRDGPRLKRLLGEAMGPDSVPDDAMLARIPFDVALLGEVGDELLRGMAEGGDSPLCIAQKAYGEKTLRTEMVLAVELDPMTAVTLAALADTAAAEMGEDGPVSWSRTKGDGPPTWSLDFSKLFRGGDPDFQDPSREMTRKMMEPWEPGIVLGSGTLYITFGPSMREDIRALCAGKVAPLSADPLFLEAMAAAEPGATEILFQRPAVFARAAMDSVRGPLDGMASAESFDPDGRDIVRALLGALDEAAGWAAGMRAQITSTLADPERRSVTVTLLDSAAAAAPPAIVMDAAPMTGPAALPAETFLLMASRMDFGPASEALKEAFFQGLNGGRDRWKRLLLDAPSPEAGELLDLMDPLATGVRGEIGFAMAYPKDPSVPDGPPTPGAISERLPTFVFYADYRDAGVVFANATSLLGKIHEAVDEGTFEDDAAAMEAGEGPPAFGLFLDKQEAAAGPSTTLRMVGAWEPGGEYFVYRIGVLRRGDRVFFTASHLGPAEVAGLPGGASTMEGRMLDELPGGAVPPASISLLIFREDGVSDVLGALLDLAVPVGPMLTLQGLGEPPSPERQAAHEAGWREGIDLVKDAMRTGKWQVMGMTREGDRWITVRRRVAGK